MKTYEYTSVASFLLVAAASLVIGLPLVLGSVLWTFGLFTVDGRDRHVEADLEFAGWVLLGGALALSFAWKHLAKHPYRVAVTGEGSIVLIRIICSVTIEPADISAIDRVGDARGVEGEDRRDLRITHTGGSDAVPYFDGAAEFIANAKSRNPGIIVTGERLI